MLRESRDFTNLRWIIDKFSVVTDAYSWSRWPGLQATQKAAETVLTKHPTRQPFVRRAGDHKALAMTNKSLKKMELSCLFTRIARIICAPASAH